MKKHKTQNENEIDLENHFRLGKYLTIDDNFFLVKKS